MHAFRLLVTSQVGREGDREDLDDSAGGKMVDVDVIGCHDDGDDFEGDNDDDCSNSNEDDYSSNNENDDDGSDALNSSNCVRFHNDGGEGVSSSIPASAGRH